MRHLTLIVAILFTSVGAASRADTQESFHTPKTSAQTHRANAESRRTLLAQSKTLCLVVPTTVLQGEISKKLTAWGRLTLVSDYSAADLVLEVRQIDAVKAYSEFRESDGGGVQHTALVRHRRSGVEVWSISKGANWATSDWTGAWAGREIADEFTRYFDTASQGSEKQDRNRPDFSGTWVLDVAQSWAGAPGETGLSPETLVVKQTATELSYERSREPGTRVIRLDGEEHVIDSPMGRIKVRARWKDDSLTMTLDAELPRERSKDALGQVAVSFLAWSLSGDGKTLTVDGIATLLKFQQTGEKVTEELKVKRVYRKQ